MKTYRTRGTGEPPSGASTDHSRSGACMRVLKQMRRALTKQAPPGLGDSGRSVLVEVADGGTLQPPKAW